MRVRVEGEDAHLPNIKYKEMKFCSKCIVDNPSHVSLRDVYSKKRVQFQSPKTDGHFFALACSISYAFNAVYDQKAVTRSCTPKIRNCTSMELG
jgi:hypothetical protein